MTRVTVKVTGVGELARDLERLPDRIVDAFHSYARANEAPWLEFLKATIQHVVYDPYDPVQYRRNLNLIKAATSDVRPYKSGASSGVIVLLQNDSSRIPPTQPKGGSQAVDVPWEIEEGNYPDVGHGWLGYALPRPAYQMTADFLRPKIEADAMVIVEVAIQKRG